MKFSPDREFRVTLQLQCMLVIPALITLSSIKVPRSLMPVDPMPCPLGYTRSLSFFVAAILICGWGLWRRPGLRLDLTAIASCILGTAGIGYILDLFFGTVFFGFPNSSATLGWMVGAWDFAQGKWLPHYLPIEEFLYYTSGVSCSLFLYLWGREVWFKEYDPAEEQLVIVAQRKFFHFQPLVFLTAIGMVTLAYVYKKNWSPPEDAGFPGYFTFFVVFVFIPGCMFFKATKTLINWRAVSMTMMVQYINALIMEALLGLPYQWWSFKRSQMMGLYIGGWTQLPIEQIFIWMATGYYTTFVYESVRIHLTRSRLRRGKAFCG